MVRTAILTAAVAWLGSGVAAAGEQTSKNGSFVVRNPTGAKICYELKWGAAGDWKSFTLEPGERRCHYYALSVHGTVPTPRLRYDSDLAPGIVKLQEFEPQTTATYDPWMGTRYTFKVSEGDRFVYLYAD